MENEGSKRGLSGDAVKPIQTLNSFQALRDEAVCIDMGDPAVEKPALSHTLNVEGSEQTNIWLVPVSFSWKFCYHCRRTKLQYKNFSN